MDVRKRFEEIFDRHRDTSAKMLTVRKNDFGRDYFAEVCPHKDHPGLGLCLEVGDEQNPGECYVSVALFACWSDDPYVSLKRYLENEGYEHNIGYLYRISRCSISGYGQEKNDPYNFSDSLRDSNFIDGRDEVIWQLNAAKAKTALSQELVDLIQEKCRVLEDERVAWIVAHTPAPEDRYKPSEPKIVRKQGTAVIAIGGYPTGAVSFGIAGKELITGNAAKFPVPATLVQCHLDIPLSKAQAKAMGKSLANFVSRLPDIGGIAGIMFVPRGITLSPVRGCKIDSVKVSQLLARSFGYPSFQLKNCLNGEPMSEILPSR